MSTAYDQDFAVWTEEQAHLLRQGRLTELDAEHIAEELQSLGKSDKRALASQIERVLMHLLKWRCQPERRSRSWVVSIASGRREIAILLADSPSLRRLVPEMIADGYTLARLRAADETGLAESVFPASCPFSADDVLTNAGLGERVEDYSD